MARILKLVGGNPFDIKCIAQYPTDTESALKAFIREQGGNPDDAHEDIVAINCWVYSDPATGELYRSHP